MNTDQIPIMAHFISLATGGTSPKARKNQEGNSQHFSSWVRMELVVGCLPLWRDVAVSAEEWTEKGAKKR